MKMARAVSIAALACAMVWLAACSSSGGQNTSGNAGGPGGAGSSSGTGASAGNGGNGDAIHYDVFLNFAAPEYPADGGKGKGVLLEKAGIQGIDFTVTLASGADYFTKLNLKAASGELPDYFSVDIPTMTRFADEGMIRPLDDLIDKAPVLKSTLRESDLEAIRYNGKIYALPVGYRPEPFNGPSIDGFLIRKDWLANVGLEQPKTLEELHEVLRRFTFDDPDGNGVDDTFGISAEKSTNQYPTKFETVFGAFGVIPHFWHNVDGRLKQGWVLPETKEALTVLQQWYAEGLIDPDFPIMERKQLEEKFINSKVGIITASGFWMTPAQPQNAAIKKLTPQAEMAILPPPVGPGGRSGYPDAGPNYGNLKALSAKAENPEKWFELLNWQATDEGQFLVFGLEGEHYTYDREKNLVSQKVTYSDLYAEGFSNPIRFFQVVDRRWLDNEESREGIMIVNNHTIENEFWKTVPAMLKYPDLPLLWSEYLVKIVTGIWTVDKWEEFVEKYYSQGGKEVEDEVNEAWSGQ